MIKKISVGLLAFLAFGCSKNVENSSIKKEGESKNWNKAVVYSTVVNTDLRISKTGEFSLSAAEQPLETQPFIYLDPQNTFQTFIGIGGAITDASAETFYKLPVEKQNEIVNAYYDAEKGIGYSLARTNMNSCDFSSVMYTYVNEKDSALTSFDIAPDRKFKIPLIKQAIEKTGNNLTLFISPWSPPAWMKDNNDMLQGGKLLSEYRQSWANYYVKFIQAYEKEGIPVWGLTVQNEPMAKQTWESCIYTAEEERDFIKEYLGPTLAKNKLDDKKLIAWDHNRDLLYHRASAILNDKEAAKYVWGIGMHWYEPWTGGDMQFENTKKVKETFPDKNLIFTEGCVDKFNKDSVNNWKIGEQYGYSMINDFNNGVAAWTDWNILLNEQGGPNHVSNFCHAPIIANTATGELTYESSYYYIGHFSKFIKPNAKRIASSSSRFNLLSTAFLNPDGQMVVVVMNKSEQAVDYKLIVGGKGVDVSSLPHSIVTILLD